MRSLKFSRQPKNPDDIHWWPFILRRVTGHSMMPILPPRTLVIGSRWFLKIKIDNVIIFEHDDKEKIKRVSGIDGQGRLYVAGEHEEASTDSRHFGSISKDTVVAKVIWPSVKPKL